ncbi:alpha/beta fold hydrolase [Rhabdothermincola sp.]|mgnify:CR=1 FL=1|uniref:alpha/beta fold hydrolase n=1 Tax=Rhabdothermincola sp. TaxID=2820405 RepID=UPI003FA6CFCE
MRFVIHNRAQLALHPLRDATAGLDRPLLLLHGLGERTPSAPPPWAEAWPGPIWGLDFTGHGASTIPTGGGYTAEMLMADADAALAELGPSTVLGRGLGAYVALLIAGGRPELVRGAILADGPGLAGGGVRPGTAYVPRLSRLGSGAEVKPSAPDPWALFELSRDVRPPDYASEYVRQAVQWSGLERPFVVAAVTRPEWLAAVVAEPGVVEGSIVEALRWFAGSGGEGRPASLPTPPR